MIENKIEKKSVLVQSTKRKWFCMNLSNKQHNINNGNGSDNKNIVDFQIELDFVIIVEYNNMLFIVMMIIITIITIIINGNWFIFKCLFCISIRIERQLAQLCLTKSSFGRNAQTKTNAHTHTVRKKEKKRKMDKIMKIV